MIHRTASITAASIAGVILAGGAAVGANVGILNAADNSELGSLSADATISTPEDITISTVAPSGLVDDSQDGPIAQTFTVDAAGMVDVEADGSGVRVTQVRTKAGWSWEETAKSSAAVELTFTSGADTLEFVAYREVDGTLTARVDRPVTASGTTPPAAVATTGSSYDDDHDDYDDDEHEDDHDEVEHEGRDDDD
jgi:hypothetical protein